jgi:tetratricopeptide (TPR) repeat protein
MGRGCEALYGGHPSGSGIFLVITGNCVFFSFKTGNWAEAVKHYTEAIRQNPEFSVIVCLIFSFKAGNWAEAVKHCTEAIHRNP